MPSSSSPSQRRARCGSTAGHQRRLDRELPRRRTRTGAPQLRIKRTAYDYAGQDPINGYDLSGTMTGGPGAPGCAYVLCGTAEGNADDPIWSTKNTIINVTLAMIPVADVLRAAGVTYSGLGRAAYTAVETSKAGVSCETPRLAPSRPHRTSQQMPLRSSRTSLAQSVPSTVL